MKATILLVALTLTAVTLGCGGKRDRQQQAAAAEELPTYSSETLRAALLANDPSVRVGTVKQIDTRSSTAAVTDVDPQEFKVGDFLSFMDLTQTPIATGKVTAVVPGGLHVQYNVIRGGRAPQEGDLALRFTR